MTADPPTPGAPGDGARPSGAAATPGRREEALAHVSGLLLEAGATQIEIDRAVADGVLDLLAVDRLLVPATRHYSATDLAEATGQPLEILKRLWRALGFLDVDDDDPVFTDLDLEAARLFEAIVSLGAADVDVALQMARVIGSSMARIAEAEVAPGVLGLRDEDEDDVLAADDFASTAGVAIPAMAWLLEFVWRRHVQAAARRQVVQRAAGQLAGTNPVLAVGFADMVGFTLLSQHLEAAELAAVVRRFEEISHDVVTASGGRLVKMIGDEAMFVIESVEGAARIGLDLAEAYADDDLLSDVRVGLALGEVLVHDGDYYGPTVNLAHRIVNIANPGTVLMSDEFHDRLLLGADDEFVAQPLRPRLLKGFGRVQLWWCGRTGQELVGSGRSADDRRNVHWERLAEVLRDLDELRGVGERLLSVGRGSGYPRAKAVSRTSDAGEAEGGDAEGA
jgi:adenylate cyclase